MKRDNYREMLRSLPEWEPFLLRESGLPGPRGNIELAQAVADEGELALFERLLANNPASAPTGSPQEFLAFCGALGLGKLLAQGQRSVLSQLRLLASDPRWRMREAVAMALQRWGEQDLAGLLDEMAVWAQGRPLEQRAAAAALCEPSLLRDPRAAERTIAILSCITASIRQVQDRKDEGFQALRKGLAYCWSVAVAACPVTGKRAMEAWLDSSDPDVRWIMRQNLKKARLARLDAEWVAECLAQLGDQ